MNERIEDVHLIPFGKYKGKTLEEVRSDVQYFDWLQNQGWFKERYGNLYQVVINNFNEPTETPEHNKIQAMFLDDEFCNRFFLCVFDKTKERTWTCKEDNSINFTTFFCENFEKINLNFEKFTLDVFLKFRIEYTSKTVWKEENSDEEHFSESSKKNTEKSFSIEIKPEIGDDWPSVMRILKEVKRRINIDVYILYDKYTGIGTSEEKFREIFNNEDIRTIKLSEITGDKK